MRYVYYNYSGRPARVMLDDKGLPEFCEVYDAQRKKLVRSAWVENDVFFNTHLAQEISAEEFEALLDGLSGYAVEYCSFNKLGEEERATCVDIVTAGGAVKLVYAEAELPLAPVVALVRSGQEIVGVGAIKRIRPYTASVARYSGYPFNPNTNELGYVAVDDKHENRGLSSRIVTALLSKHDGPLFATTDDDRMKNTLRKAGFQMKGHEWDGDRGCLSLWLKD